MIFLKSNIGENKGGYNMINLLSQSGHTTYGLKDFIIDTKADLDNLPVDVPAGCTAFCIEDSSAYMINSSGEWVEI